jgi:hypothetical protein
MKFAAAGGLVAIGFAMSPAGARAQDAEAEPPEATPCVLTSAWVDRGTASFTVGPVDCDGPVGPLSFSAFELPGGMRVPYDAQELIAHHPDNGSTYPAGSYSLTLEIGDPCNWQTDLYRGGSAVPFFGDKLVVADYVENRDCTDETTSTTSPTSTSTTSTTSTTSPTTTSPTTTTVAGGSGETTTTVAGGSGGTTTTTTDAASAGPTTTDVESAGPTTTDAASAGPTTTQSVRGNGATSPAGRSAPTGSLPTTGPTDTLLIGLLGGTLIGLGTLARRVTRS